MTGARPPGSYGLTSPVAVCGDVIVVGGRVSEQLWETRLPAAGHATPMTYRGRRTGKQFVVVAAGGGNRLGDGISGKLVAFLLPGDGEGIPGAGAQR